MNGIEFKQHPKARRPKMDLEFRRAVAESRRRGDLQFSALLSEGRIHEAFGKARWL
jgi:hypothetical protein